MTPPVIFCEPLWEALEQMMPSPAWRAAQTPDIYQLLGQLRTYRSRYTWSGALFDIYYCLRAEERDQ